MTRSTFHAHATAAVRRLRRDDRAVSEIVGTLLLISLTVVSAGAFALFMSSLEAPEPAGQTDIEAFLSPGADGWGTGDERLILRHAGGRPIPTSGTEIHFTTSDGETIITGDALGGAFADGQWSIGDSWSTTLLANEAGVTVQVIVQSGGTSRLLFDGTAAAFGGSTP